MRAKKIPISLYIHTPWCLHKCPYCDFNSHAHEGALPEKPYIDALINDFKQQLPLLQGRHIQSIFIGGGTPSLLSSESYQHLLTELRQLSDISDTAEITLEANPGTFEQDRFAAYRSAGINRLSVGVQSFQNEKLKQLQRIHNNDDAINAIKTAKHVGFDNINIDLMFGLPNQNIDDGLYDLQTALDLEPTHLSWYQLTIEPHTYFYAHPPKLPNDDAIWELQLQGQQLLAKKAYQHYETSAYALPNRQCQHNRNYWTYGDYLGIGAGAHGKITDCNTQTIIRRWNHKNPKDYLNPDKAFINGSNVVAVDERPLEFMMNVLRLQEPISLSIFNERTGCDIESIKRILNKAEEQDLLTWNDTEIIVTQHGHRYLNELLTLF